MDVSQGHTKTRVVLLEVDFKLNNTRCEKIAMIHLVQRKQFSRRFTLTASRQWSAVILRFQVLIL